jgi:hypothetical protein
LRLLRSTCLPSPKWSRRPSRERVAIRVVAVAVGPARMAIPVPLVRLIPSRLRRLPSSRSLSLRRRRPRPKKHLQRHRAVAVGAAIASLKAGRPRQTWRHPLNHQLLSLPLSKKLPRPKPRHDAGCAVPASRLEKRAHRFRKRLRRSSRRLPPNPSGHRGPASRRRLPSNKGSGTASIAVPGLDDK